MHVTCLSLPQAPRLRPQLEFINALISIGQRLGAMPTREAKTTQLLNELSVLNLNLPARVWLPLHGPGHHVVRIPAQAAAVLNSKVGLHCTALRLLAVWWGGGRHAGRRGVLV